MRHKKQQQGDNITENKQKQQQSNQINPPKSKTKY